MVAFKWIYLSIACTILLDRKFKDYLKNFPTKAQENFAWKAIFQVDPFLLKYHQKMQKYNSLEFTRSI